MRGPPDDLRSLERSVAYAAPRARPAAVRAVVDVFLDVMVKRDGGTVALLATLAEMFDPQPPEELEPSPRVCASCGAPFTPARTWGRYCSTRCRVRAFRSR